MRIENLANWSNPTRVRTKLGPRDLCKASPTEPFWQAWKKDKQKLKDAGVSLTKDNGYWEVLWWMPIPEEEQKEREEALDASRATDADIEIPCPANLAFLPYQKAGIKYALQKFGCL